MTVTVQPVRGMNDVLPAQIGAWQQLERVTRELFAAYGYEEVRLPLLEHTALFKRAIGEFTDIVEKEMYTFEDSGGDSLTLRPEATAGVVRAAISNGLLRGARLKLWTSGPMFRHERPQKGRYRQFHQIDIEAIGFAGPDIDAEMIAMTARLWKQLGISRVRLKINSLGTAEARRGYREKLVDYFRTHESSLDEDSRRRLSGNPLRILDSKNPAMQAVVSGAPLLTDHLDGESREHFQQLTTTLTAMGVPFSIEPRLVRGLDYYSRTAFEWSTDALGAQDAVCGGGRYDTLIEQLGGEATPAIGFAMGVERITELMQLAGVVDAAAGADVFIVAVGEAAASRGLVLAEQLREALPGVKVQSNLGGGNFKAQFRRADRSGARLALVLGEDELARGVVNVKPMRDESGQTECPLDSLPSFVRGALASAPSV
jgi:histidyl-tRNA synthetase